MRYTVRPVGFQQKIASLNGTGHRLQAAWLKDGKAVGDDAVGEIQEKYRSGPTGKKTTQVRRGQLRRAYDSAAKPAGRGPAVDVSVGLIRPGTTAEVLRHGRLQEGLNADGSRFTSKTIRAKGAGFLHAPIFDPNVPGVAKSNIIGWFKVKQVVFRPRPTFPAIKKKYTPILQARASATLRRIVGGAAA